MMIEICIKAESKLPTVALLFEVYDGVVIDSLNWDMFMNEVSSSFPGLWGDGSDPTKALLNNSPVALVKAQFMDSAQTRRTYYVKPSDISECPKAPAVITDGKAIAKTGTSVFNSAKTMLSGIDEKYYYAAGAFILGIVITKLLWK